MKEITKDDKGITIVVLIITVILLLILAGVVTYSGKETYNKAKVTKFVTQMQLIQKKVDEIENLDELTKLGNSITTEPQITAIQNAYQNQEITSSDTSKYRVFTKNEIMDMFSIEDFENDIMINYETGEIIDLIGTKYEGKMYYTQYKLPQGQTRITEHFENTRDTSFDLNLSIKGINGNVKIKNIKITNGTLLYKEDKSINWEQITNYTETNKIKEINISEDGTYTFKLQDNENKENYTQNTIKITLANSPKTNSNLQYNYGRDSSNWAYQVFNGISYVWIPRFAYNTDSDTGVTEIKFLKGNSDVATDNIKINDNWTISNKFTSGATKLTGVWVQCNRQSNLDMINLLESSVAILSKIDI